MGSTFVSSCGARESVGVGVARGFRTTLIDEGRSGSSIEGRDELKRLLADAGSGRFERVIFWRLDRLGRSLRDLLRICDDLEAAGVGIVSIQESTDTGTAAGRMMRSILGALGEFEHDVIVSRMKAGIEEKARGGELVGPLPLSYRRDEANTVVIDEATAPLVREAFERYASGHHSLREMGQWATSAGLCSAEGNPLDRLSARKLVTNVTYKGDVAFHGRAGGGFTVKGEHPAIVDEELFDKLQNVLVSRRRNIASSRPFGRQPYPLSGVATCGACSAPLLGAATVTGKYRYRHMRCSTAQRRGKDACSQK